MSGEPHTRCAVPTRRELLTAATTTAFTDAILAKV
jgi:hypothetical protein